MKKTILLLIVGVALWSCDKRMDYFSESNVPVEGVVQMTNSHSSSTATVNGNDIRDTMKLGNPIHFSLDLTDEITSIRFKFTGDGDLELNGEAVGEGEESVVDISSTLNFKWDVAAQGVYYFKLAFTDAYDEVTIYNFKIVVFVNRIPNISWTLNPVGNLSSMDYQFYVEGYDADVLWGGGIIYYEYVINGDTTFYPWHNMSYVFPEPGQYYISVRAMDNDNAWSNTVTQANFVIN